MNLIPTTRSLALCLASVLILASCAQSASQEAGPLNPSFGVPVENPYQPYVASDDIDPSYEAEYRQVMANLNSFVGGYSGFVTLIFSTPENSSSVFEALKPFVEMGHSGALEQNCLGSVGDPPNKFGICLNEEQWYFYTGREPSETSLADSRVDVYTGIAHEYFHWFQNNMAGQKHLDYQQEPSVMAPTWWVEGTADLFSFLWLKENAAKFAVFQGGIPPRVEDRISPLFTSWNVDMYLKTCGDPDLNTGERYDTETSCSPSPWLAVAHLASLSSYQSVFVDIPRDFREMDFAGAFEKNIGMTVEGFYFEHHSWLKSLTGPAAESDISDVFPSGSLSAEVKFPGT